jgi:hypothetical protein
MKARRQEAFNEKMTRKQEEEAKKKREGEENANYMSWLNVPQTDWAPTFPDGSHPPELTSPTTPAADHSAVSSTSITSGDAPTSLQGHPHGNSNSNNNDNSNNSDNSNNNDNSSNNDNSNNTSANGNIGSSGSGSNSSNSSSSGSSTINGTTITNSTLNSYVPKP